MKVATSLAKSYNIPQKTTIEYNRYMYIETIYWLVLTGT